MTEKNWLHLFSSNIRELYIADAVDLLAAPTGFIYQFRYQEEHVQDEARQRWSGASWRRGGMRGCKVAVYYSMQHAANFHPAAYVPLRRGEVYNAFVEGKTYVVQYRLEGYAPLPEPAQGEQRDAIVRNFTEQLKSMLQPSYPDYADVHGSARPERRSATLGASPVGLLDPSGDEGATFERVVRYMSDALAPQHPYLFLRVASIWKGNSNTSETLSKDGYLHVVAGNHYVVEVAHYQPSSPPPGAALQVTAPPGLDLLTPSEVPISSRYDVVPVRLFPPFRDNEVQGELILKIKAPGLGSNVRLPVRTTPSWTHSFFSPLVAVVGAFCVVVPATLGQSASVEPKLWFAATGAILITLGVWTRRSKGLS